MPHVLHHLIRCIAKQWICMLVVTLVLGAIIKLLYFGSTSMERSSEFAVNTNSDLTSPTLCVVARIYWAQMTYFPVFALALYHSGLPNIRIYTVNTDSRTNIKQLQQTIKFINGLVSRPDFVILLELGEPPVGKDYGYEMTDRALTYLYQQHMNTSSLCQYIIFTNGDNIYSRSLGKKILPHMKHGKDVIGWGFVSHHYRPDRKESIASTKKTTSEIVDDGTEKCIPMELRTNFADLGAVAYRFLFLLQHNLYFRRPNEPYIFGSDGYFIEQAAKQASVSVILRQTLFLHQ